MKQQLQWAARGFPCCPLIPYGKGRDGVGKKEETVCPCPRRQRSATADTCGGDCTGRFGIYPYWYSVVPINGKGLWSLFPYQFPEKLIPLIIKKAQNDENLPVYGKGENVRDWLHVLDHCSAIDLIVRNGKVGEVYNIGGHNERTNLEVVKTILKVLGKPESLITYVTDRPGHDRRYAIDPTKMETELGWKPVYNFDTGIVETIKWNVENKTWLENVESGEYQNWLDRHYGK